MRMVRSPSIRSLMFALLVVLASTVASFGQVSISITIAPPALPVYEQPICPAEGYIWIPGYWTYDYDEGDYYWVPGTWVLAPEVGLLWTPPYWAWVDTGFVFYEGYWSPHVGFYGGIVYGFGYFGRGYEGGRWDNGHFYYNRTVNNVNITNIHNVYSTTIVNNITVNHVSYNGGNGGINARPTPEEEAAAHERHVPPVPAQIQHVQAARANPQLRASANLGRPPIAATPKPSAFKDRAVVPAKEAGAPYHPPANHAGTPAHRENTDTHPVPAIHPNDLPPREHPAPPNTGDPKLDQKYLQQQENLGAKQDRERQALQHQQDLEHQRLTPQAANQARMQQLETKHQQQTQQLQQKHQMQVQKLQTQQAVNRNQAKPTGGKPH